MASPEWFFLDNMSNEQKLRVIYRAMWSMGDIDKLKAIIEVAQEHLANCEAHERFMAKREAAPLPF